MNYPLLSEYKEAILWAEDNFEAMNMLRSVKDERGEPIMSSGNFAVVFKMEDIQTKKTVCREMLPQRTGRTCGKLSKNSKRTRVCKILLSDFHKISGKRIICQFTSYKRDGIPHSADGLGGWSHSGQLPQRTPARILYTGNAFIPIQPVGNLVADPAFCAWRPETGQHPGAPRR